MIELGRVITAMITPFDDEGQVDYDESALLAKALVSSGSEGLVVTGTTGESPTLTAEERLGLYRAVKAAVGDSAAVIAGTGTNNTAESIANSQDAEREGADAVLLVVPSYNKPPQEGLYQHFRAVAEAVSIPCILYNVPGRTSLNMAAETTIRLSEIDNVVGVKEAGGDLGQITRIIQSAGGDFRVWSGNDDETFYIVAAGGYGVVSVASHLVGEQIKGMIGMLLEGEIEAAAAEHRRLLELNKVIFTVSNPIPIKHAVAKRGYRVGRPRLPLVSLTMEQASQIERVIDRYSIDLPAR
jgi:4-hydroxy-tetrahydrodipicolinate synthase